ncbi:MULTISPECIES: energy-coupling factor ABC transporter ATP-binding protein [unclassified Leifsonia]|uniref:energy-coupling factor ABC transporter ATP-binding protein n=1 Tax=unclassified Leifsonia TaxID=2663824 RepID=UPI0007019CF8|nr:MULTISPECIES: ABC transporter ATP-binding protein [unclassified Leifsonia]KQX07301.1 cobalt ABC transporter ATP-binding protein [Leifsonia sp. Root1293]KRA11584.1 cobalt ABC transporter ATP-binding protein [Leifsonia sp. Root60]
MGDIRFEAVDHRFGDDAVLRDIDLRLTEQRIGVVGANGSGKSTLVRLVNGLVSPQQGHVLVDGLDVAKHAREVRRRVGFIFTNPDTQIVMPTVREDVAFSVRRLKLPAPEAAARVDAALERFGLDALADRAAHKLSGGQKQLLALAAVLVTEPAIVIADEPTTLLDGRNARIVTEYLRTLEQQLIVVTHQLELLEDFDRVIVMDEGRVVADGAPGPALELYRAAIR